MNTPESCYWEFFRTDSAQQAEAWAAVMSYPHVRVSSEPGSIAYYETATEYASRANWADRIATGWVRSDGLPVKRTLEHECAVHLSGGWTRFNAANEPILTNRVTYITTKLDSSWGIQARFACGAMKEWQEDEGNEPLDLVSQYILALQAHDFERCSAFVRFPLIVVGVGTVEEFDDASSFTSYLKNTHVPDYDLATVKTVQNGPSGANVAAQSTTNSTTNSGQSLFLVSKTTSPAKIAGLSLIR